MTAGWLPPDAAQAWSALPGLLRPAVDLALALAGLELLWRLSRPALRAPQALCHLLAGLGLMLALRLALAEQLPGPATSAAVLGALSAAGLAHLLAALGWPRPAVARPPAPRAAVASTDPSPAEEALPP